MTESLHRKPRAEEDWDVVAFRAEKEFRKQKQADGAVNLAATARALGIERDAFYRVAQLKNLARQYDRLVKRKPQRS